MHHEVEMLRRENAALRAQLAELLSTNTKLVAELAKLNVSAARATSVRGRDDLVEWGGGDGAFSAGLAARAVSWGAAR